MTDEKKEKPKRDRGAGMIFTKRGIYWVKYHDRGVAYRESTGKRGREGESAARKLLGLRTGQRFAGKFRPGAESVRVADLKRLVLLDYDLNGRRSKKRVEQCYAHLEEFFAFRPAIDVPQHAAEYVAARIAEKAASATIRNEIRALGRGFKLAVRDKLLTDIPVLPTVRAAVVRTGFVDDETMAKVVAALPEHMAPLAEFCFRTAWRRGEAAGLLWTDVDWERGEITLPGTRTKSGKPATFPFVADRRLARLLEEQRARTDEWSLRRGEVVPLVFWRGTRRGAVPVRDCRKSWDTARKAAGVPWLLLHDTRRSRARLWSQRGVPDRVGMQLGHWATRSVYDRYRIVSDADMRQALEQSARAERATARPRRASRPTARKRA